MMRSRNFNTKNSKNHTESTEKLDHRVLALRSNTQKLRELCEKNSVNFVLNKLVSVLLFILFISSFSFSQSWRETLETARNLYAIKNYPAAYKTYQQLAKQLPSNIQLDAEIGQAAYKAGDYWNSARYYENYNLNISDTKQKNYFNLGNAYFKLKDYGKAIELYKNELRRNPKNDIARYNLSLALKRYKPKKPKEKIIKPTNKKESKIKKSNESQDSLLKNNFTERILDNLNKKEIESYNKILQKKIKKKNYGKDW